jgi:hypothetical protein
VIGEGEYVSKVLGGGAGGSDSLTLLIRELSNSRSVQRGADKEQLSAGTLVLLFDAIPVKVRSGAAVWDFENTGVPGWHTPREERYERAADCQKCEIHAGTGRRPGSFAIIRAGTTRKEECAAYP